MVIFQKNGGSCPNHQDGGKKLGGMIADKGLAERKYKKFMAGCKEDMERDTYDPETKKVIKELRKDCDAQADTLEEGLAILEGNLRTEGKKKPLAELI